MKCFRTNLKCFGKFETFRKVLFHYTLKYFQTNLKCFNDSKHFEVNINPKKNWKHFSYQFLQINLKFWSEYKLKPMAGLTLYVQLAWWAGAQPSASASARAQRAVRAAPAFPRTLLRRDRVKSHKATPPARPPVRWLLRWNLMKSLNAMYRRPRGGGGGRQNAGGRRIKLLL